MIYFHKFSKVKLNTYLLKPRKQDCILAEILWLKLAKMTKFSTVFANLSVRATPHQDLWPL